MRAPPRAALIFLLLPMALLATGCDDAASPEPLTPDDALRSHAASDMAVHAYRAHLTGDAEVPAVDTRARGQAVFRLSADGTELSYRLLVANIEDVTMAHIHLAPAGENGPPVVWLYPDAPPPQLIEGRFSGVLATGSITAADLAGPFADASMEALVEAMGSGRTYVNVHTTAHPGGEVRGQISGES